MSNRKYRLIVAGQVSMITLLFLFVLNAEQLLQAWRERSSIEASLAAIRRAANGRSIGAYALAASFFSR